MKYALQIKYTAPSGEESLMDYLRCDTADHRAESLAALESADVLQFLSADEQSALTTILNYSDADNDAAESTSLLVLLDETNYPLPVLLPRDTEAFGATLHTQESPFSEGTLCDGGPSRRETLIHARQAFRTIEGIPSTLTLLLERVTALESLSVPTAPTPPETPVVPATESPNPVADAPLVPESADPELDTPTASITVESPLLPESPQPVVATSPTAPEDDFALTPEMLGSVKKFARGFTSGPFTLK